jgi:hypothetical protein
METLTLYPARSGINDTLAEPCPLSRSERLATVEYFSADAFPLGRDLHGWLLLIPDFSSDFYGINNRHDHSVNRFVACHLGLPRRTAGGNEDNFADTGTHSIYSDRIFPIDLSVEIHILDNHQFAADQFFILLRCDDCPGNFSKDHLIKSLSYE